MLNVFIGVIFRWQRRIAKRELALKSVRNMSPAAITAIHRVGSAINLNLHFHSVVTDGVFVRDTPGERPMFRALPAPTKTDVTALAWEVCQKTTRILRKLGRDSDSDSDTGDADVLARDQPLLAQCYAASLQGFVALGARVGQRVQRRGQFAEHGSDSDSRAITARGHPTRRSDRWWFPVPRPPSSCACRSSTRKRHSVRNRGVVIARDGLTRSHGASLPNERSPSTSNNAQRAATRPSAS